MRQVIILCFLTALFFSSCTIEKRHYRNGFYIQKNKTVKLCSVADNKRASFFSSLQPAEAQKHVQPFVFIIHGSVPEKVKQKASNNSGATVLGKSKEERTASVMHSPKPKDNYHSRPFLIIGAGLFSLLLIGLSVWLFILGGFVLTAIIALLLSDSIAFLAYLSINPDDIKTLSQGKRTILKIGQAMIFTTLIILFPISLIWFLVYVNFMLGGDST
jgi:hypothetical protein